MFKNNYQGGAVVEVFSAQGKDPVAKWKLYGGPSAIHKEFDKEVKGFVYCLDGSSQTIKIQMPEDGKMPLGLLQRFLVLQVNVPQCKDFSTELVITDVGHLKRRLYLSTVHKEFSATPLHARIPFVGLKRNIWSNLCIDLVSLTDELFKRAGFLTLDGITISASCKLRRIFTMKSEPVGSSDGDVFQSGTDLADLIPRSCQFLPDVQHVTQLLNMERVRLADVKTGIVNSECDQSGTAGSTSSRRSRIQQDSSHIAFGSRVSGPPPQTGRKASGTSEGMDGRALHTGPGSSAGISQTCAPGIQRHGDRNEKSSHGEQPGHPLHKNDMEFKLIGRPGGLQPHPPRDRASDRQGSKKLRVHSAGLERSAPSAPPDDVLAACGDRRETRETSSPPSRMGESSRQPLTLKEMREDQTADELLSNGPSEECAGVRPGQSLSCGSSTGPPSSGSAVWTGLRENNHNWSEPEPQLTLEDAEEVFTFSSQPHTARRGQGHGEQKEEEEERVVETNESGVQRETRRRDGAQPEDDFIGSESEEDEFYTKFLHQRASVGSSPITATSPSPAGDVPLKVQPGSHGAADQRSPRVLNPANTTNMPQHSPSSRRAETAGMVPTRCLSPNGNRKGHIHGPGEPGIPTRAPGTTSLSRRSLREVPLEACRLQKEDEDKRREPVRSRSSCELHLRSGLRMQEEEEELRMLASLQREQVDEEEEEEEEGGASGLSASQIHQCNVSISTSSDDTSTWTHIPPPANQGHHYQKEMNPLLHSNPREWMDVLSPPIIPPSQRGRSVKSTRVHHKEPIRGMDVSVTEGENEEEYLNLLYDPCLNCYFDPQTGKYYELA